MHLGVWEVLRCIALCAAFTVLPGLGIQAVLSRRHGSRSGDALGLAVGWSIALNILTIGAVEATGGALASFAVVVMVLAAAGGVSASIIALQSRTRAQSGGSRRLAFSAVVAVIGVVWFLAILRSGPRIDYEWDQWFHIAHIRQALEGNALTPDNPYWSDVRLSDMYGSWHTMLAAVAHIAQIDVVKLWWIANAYMAALGFYTVYSVAGALLSSRAQRLVAAIVFLGSGFGALDITRTFAYPWGICCLTMFASLGQLFRYIDNGARRHLVHTVVIGLTPVLIHPHEYMFLCFAAFALACSAGLPLMRGDRDPVLGKRARVALLWLVLSGLPLLFTLYHDRIITYVDPPTGSGSGTALPLYTLPLAKVLALAFPYYWKLGLLLKSLVPFSLITLAVLRGLSESLSPRLRWFLRTLTIAPLLATLFPGLSWITQLVLKETYSWRLLNLVPTPLVWAPILTGTVRHRLLRRQSMSTRIAHVSPRLNLPHVVLVIVMVSCVALAVQMTVCHNPLDPAVASPLHAQPMFRSLEEDGVPGTALSDPTTSYAIPGMSRHSVVLNEPTHGSRADIRTRYAATRELISDRYQTAEDAAATLERYSIDYIVLNQAFWDKEHILGVPFYSDYTHVFLDTNPTCFHPVHADDVLRAYRYTGCSADEILGKGLDQPASISASPIAHQVQVEVASGLDLVGYTLARQTTTDSDVAVDVDVYWQSQKSAHQAYVVWLELLCNYQGRDLPYGKLLREAEEVRHNVTLRTVASDTLYLPAAAPQQVLVAQSFSLRLPDNPSGEPCSLAMYLLDHHQASRGQEALPYWLMELEYTLPQVHLVPISVE